MRYTILQFGRATAVALFVLIGAATALAGGPPWISVEAPVDPLNRSARGAALLIRVYSCGEATDTPVEAAAEGLVGGERRSIAIKLKPTGERGVYAVDQQWPAEGAWVLTLTLPKLAPTTTLVQLGPNGGVEADQYYDQASKVLKLASVRVFGRRLNAEEVNTALRSAQGAVATIAGEPEQQTGQGWLIAAFGAPLLLGGWFAARRRRG